jgi:hypothetical protein
MHLLVIRSVATKHTSTACICNPSAAKARPETTFMLLLLLLLLVHRGHKRAWVLRWSAASVAASVIR